MTSKLRALERVVLKAAMKQYQRDKKVWPLLHIAIISGKSKNPEYILHRACARLAASHRRKGKR